MGEWASRMDEWASGRAGVDEWSRQVGVGVGVGEWEWEWGWASGEWGFVGFVGPWLAQCMLGTIHASDSLKVSDTFYLNRILLENIGGTQIRGFFGLDKTGGCLN